MKDMYIVTGASDNHFKSLKQFLRSVNGHTCYVYNLGLSEKNIKELKTFDILYRVFDYSQYPDYYNIQINAGEYAWKSAIIKQTMDEIQQTDTTVLVWCDAGNIIAHNLDNIQKSVQQNRIHSPTSGGNICKWVHTKTLEWFYISPDHTCLTLQMRNAAILGFCIGDTDVRDFINEFYACSKIRECIAPIGSSRINHRQDQAVFTILYYRFMERHPRYTINDSCCGIRIHCDCD